MKNSTCAGLALRLDPAHSNKMDLDYIEKKLREARFFLNKMAEHEGMAVGDNEPFDFYLSAFLNAGMSVRNAFYVRLDRNPNAVLKAWQQRWESSLSPAEKSIYEFMRKDRIAEVHKAGSSRTIKAENRELKAGTHTFASGTMEVFGPPDVSPLAVIRTPAYTFTISGTNRKAVDVCGEYLTLLDQMIAKFKSDYVR
jgi:hypothetical protein